MSLNRMQRHFARLKWEILLEEVVEVVDTEIIDLNTSQLEVGRDSLGEMLDTYASSNYAIYKKSIGSQAPLGIPNLKLEGDFYRGFICNAERGDIVITSRDSKTGKLKEKYGDDIFGIEKGLKDILLPHIINIAMS